MPTQPKYTAGRRKNAWNMPARILGVLRQAMAAQYGLVRLHRDERVQATPQQQMLSGKQVDPAEALAFGI
jgi:hypothetical protein